MPWADHHPAADSAEQYLQGTIPLWDRREDLGMSIWRKSDGLFIGGCGVHHINWQVPRFEIGYWVRASCQRKGYITKTAVGLRDFLFAELKAERVEIRCNADNVRSAAVAQRAGFTLKAKLRHHRRNMQGELRDTLIYTLLRDGWLALTRAE